MECYKTKIDTGIAIKIRKNKPDRVLRGQLNSLGWKIFNRNQCRIAQAKAAFNKNRKLFKFKKLELATANNFIKAFVWSIYFYGAESWTLRKVDIAQLKEVFN